MGKLKKKPKARASRADPIYSHVLPNEPATEEEQQESKSMVPPILSKLDSIETTEREWACSALSNLILEPESLQVLMQNNVIKKLTERLVDQDPLVQVGAAGALRNLAVEGDDGVRREMLKKDVLTPLLHLFPGAVGKLKAINADPTAENMEKKGLISSFLEQVLVILWCLCESFDKAIEHLNNQDSFFESLLEMMHSQVVSRKGAIVAAVQFLNTVTEENEVLCRKFAGNQAACRFLVEYASVKTHAGENSSLVRILVASILWNLRDAVTDVTVLTVILPVIAQVLNFDSGAVIAEVIRDHPDYFASQELDAEEKEDRIDMRVLGQIKSNLVSQQLALELMANICSDNNTGDEWEDMDDDSETNNVEMKESAPPNPAGSQPQAYEVIGNTPILLQLALQRSAFIAPEAYQFLVNHRRGKEIAAVLVQVQERAISSLNNLAIALPSAKLTNVQQWWNQLIDVGIKSTNVPGVNATQLLEEVTQACWSIARYHPVTPTQEHFEALKGGALTSQVEEIRVNCIGTLGVFAHSTDSPQICTLVTEVLLQSLHDGSLWVVCEGLNAIFDIFGDKDKNEVFVNLRVHQMLVECRAKLEPLKKQLSKKDGDLYGRVNETFVNLKRFIEYKQNEK